MAIDVLGSILDSSYAMIFKFVMIVCHSSMYYVGQFSIHALVHPIRRSPASYSSTAGYGWWRDYRGIVKYEVDHHAVAAANMVILQLLPGAQVREHHDKRTFNSVYAPANTLNLKHLRGAGGVGKWTWLGGGRLYQQHSCHVSFCSDPMKTIYDQSCCASFSFSCWSLMWSCWKSAGTLVGPTVRKSVWNRIPHSTVRKWSR